MSLIQYWQYKTHSINISSYYRTLSNKLKKLKESHPNYSKSEFCDHLNITEKVFALIENLPLEVSLDEKVTRSLNSTADIFYKSDLIPDNKSNYLDEYSLEFEEVNLPQSWLIAEKLGFNVILDKIKQSIPLTEQEEMMILQFCKKQKKRK